MKQFNLDYLPDNPGSAYRGKGWKNYRDFYGNEFLPFEKAKDFVRSFNFKNRDKWREYCRSGEKPNNIPSNPPNIYIKEWEGWFDWLGTDNNLGGVDTRRLKLSFEDARQFAHNLGFTRVEQWRKWSRSEQRPLEIPSDPPNAYRKLWKGWGDWLGDKTIRVFYKNRDIETFEKTRNYAINSTISTLQEWLDAYAEGMLPTNFPKSPQYAYVSQWEGWGDFLGTENNISRSKKFITFEEAKKIIKNKFKKKKDWDKYKNSKNFPYFLPKTPDSAYKKQWISWGDFLGTGNIAYQKRTYFSYDESQKLICNLGIISSTQWYDYWSKHPIPDHLPKAPWEVYKKEWNKKGGWGGFLGTGTVATIKRKFISFIELKNLLNKNGIKLQREYFKFVKHNKNIVSIPYHPEITYKDKWVDWYDFLGANKK